MAVLTEEQALLKDAAAAWAQERSPIAAVRKLFRADEGIGFDRALFAEMAEMGWAGVVTPEAYGGADFGFFSMGIVLEQLGATLTPSPLTVSSLAAGTALREAGSDAQKSSWLTKIAAGEAVVTLAVDEGAHHDPLGVKLSATKTPTGYRLDGAKRPVLHGMAADAAIVSARTSGHAGQRDGITLFLVPTDAAGLARTKLTEIEPRAAARFEFSGVEVDASARLGPEHDGAGLLEHMLDCARVGVAAEMLGSAQAAFDTTLAYLKTRMQFGRLIGEFQALQHRAAALAGELHLTRSAVESALKALDERQQNAGELVSVAKALAGDTFRRVAGEMIQMHGGIGMTAEHDAGLFLKRARMADMSFGGAAFHRERYAALCGY